MSADSRTYPAMVIAGMYKREQELAKADEAGLTITYKDLEDEPMACVNCAYVTDHICEDCEAYE